MRSILLALLLTRASEALDTISVDGNPHTGHENMEGAACCPAQRLPVETLLPMPALLSMQADTFVDAKTRRHGDIPVQVFTFRQPDRLSHLMLPFDLALVSSIDPTGIIEVPAPAAQSADSWFPDCAHIFSPPHTDATRGRSHAPRRSDVRVRASPARAPFVAADAWSHFIVCRGSHDDAAAAQHLGWRFTRKPGAAGAGPQTFVALIVASKRSKAAEAARATAVRVDVRGGTTLREDDDSDAAALADEDEVEVGAENAPPLQIGVEAPGWMTAMLAAVTARVSTSAPGRSV